MNPRGNHSSIPGVDLDGLDTFEAEFLAIEREEQEDFHRFDRRFDSKHEGESYHREDISSNKPVSIPMPKPDLRRLQFSDDWLNKLPTYSKLQEITAENEKQEQRAHKQNGKPRKSSEPTPQHREAYFQPSPSFGVPAAEISQYATKFLFVSTMTAAERDLFGGLMTPDSSPMAYLASPAAHEQHGDLSDDQRQSFVEERPTKRRRSELPSQSEAVKYNFPTPDSTSFAPLDDSLSKERKGDKNDSLKNDLTQEEDDDNFLREITHEIGEQEPEINDSSKKADVISTAPLQRTITGDLELDLDIQGGEHDWVL